jgi:hypothetical protein
MPSPYGFPVHFTLEDANRFLPAVREIFNKVHALLLPRQKSLKDLAQASGNGRKKKSTDASEALTPQDRQELAQNLLDELADKGIVVQDWRRGLIDFPHIRGGREVFLCYELTDGPEIRYYHDLDAGFGGRKPV